MWFYLLLCSLSFLFFVLCCWLHSLSIKQMSFAAVTQAIKWPDCCFCATYLQKTPNVFVPWCSSRLFILIFPLSTSLLKPHTLNLTHTRVPLVYVSFPLNECHETDMHECINMHCIKTSLQWRMTSSCMQAHTHTHTHTHTMQCVASLSTSISALPLSAPSLPSSCHVLLLLFKNASLEMHGLPIPVMSGTGARASVKAADHNSVHNCSDKNKCHQWTGQAACDHMTNRVADVERQHTRQSRSSWTQQLYSSACCVASFNQEGLMSLHRPWPMRFPLVGFVLGINCKWTVIFLRKKEFLEILKEILQENLVIPLKPCIWNLYPSKFTNWFSQWQAIHAGARAEGTEVGLHWLLLQWFYGLCRLDVNTRKVYPFFHGKNLRAAFHRL